MTELLQPPIDDDRVIISEDERYDAEIVRRIDYTDDLARIWVKYRGAPVHFEPGQYMTIGVFADGKLWQRPYSIASSPREAQPTTRPGMSRKGVIELSLWKCPPKPRW